MLLPDIAHAIQLVVLDVDGVLTDGSIWTSPSGEAAKRFDVKDGFAIKMLQKAGLEIAIITGRSSEIVAHRARELGIEHVYQGQVNKIAAFRDLLQRLQLTPEQVAYIGDDIPDLPLMMQVGLAVCPFDASADVVRVAHVRTQALGGRGAIREFGENLLKIRGQWYPLIEAHYLTSPQ